MEPTRLHVKIYKGWTRMCPVHEDVWTITRLVSFHLFVSWHAVWWHKLTGSPWEYLVHVRPYYWCRETCRRIRPQGFWSLVGKPPLPLFSNLCHLTRTKQVGRHFYAIPSLHQVLRTFTSGSRDPNANPDTWNEIPKAYVTPLLFLYL